MAQTHVLKFLNKTQVNRAIFISANLMDLSTQSSQKNLNGNFVYFSDCINQLCGL